MYIFCLFYFYVKVRNKTSPLFIVCVCMMDDITPTTPEASFLQPRCRCRCRCRCHPGGGREGGGAASLVWPNGICVSSSIYIVLLQQRQWQPSNDEIFFFLFSYFLCLCFVFCVLCFCVCSRCWERARQRTCQTGPF